MVAAKAPEKVGGISECFRQVQQGCGRDEQLLVWKIQTRSRVELAYECTPGLGAEWLR
jgi:hypothetical protein